MQPIKGFFVLKERFCAKGELHSFGNIFFIFAQAKNSIRLLRLHFRSREAACIPMVWTGQSVYGVGPPYSVSPCAFQVLSIPYKLQSFVVQNTVLF